MKTKTLSFMEFTVQWGENWQKESKRCFGGKQQHIRGIGSVGVWGTVVSQIEKASHWENDIRTKAEKRWGKDSCRCLEQEFPEEGTNCMGNSSESEEHLESPRKESMVGGEVKDVMRE